jgi:hypothetical protein
MTRVLREKPIPGPERRPLVAGAAVALLLAEALLRLVGLPSDAPFLQEFYGKGFKLMCYDANPSGALDIDLRDPQQRAPLAARFEAEGNGPAFEAHWPKTPYAVEVRLNAMGFRDREFEAKPEGVRRIVIVGDSFTYGHGLPEAESYPRQLEALLRAARPGERVDVYDAAGGGTTSRASRRSRPACSNGSSPTCSSTATS